MRCSTYLFYCIYYLQTDHILQPHRNTVQKITNGRFLWSDDFDETLISLRKDCQKKILAVKHHQQGSGSSRHWDTILQTTPIFVCSWTNFSTAWMNASHPILSTTYSNFTTSLPMPFIFHFPHASKRKCECFHCSKISGMNMNVRHSNVDETRAILLLLPVLAPAFVHHAVDFSLSPWSCSRSPFSWLDTNTDPIPNKSSKSHETRIRP